MGDLNQFINPDLNTNDILHSNAYGQASGGGGAGGLSMDARQKKVGQTRVVGSYQYSKLGSQRSVQRANPAGKTSGQVYDPSTGQFVGGSTSSGKPDDTSAPYGNSRQMGDIKNSSQIDKSTQQRQQFREPPSRGYNPFS